MCLYNASPWCWLLQPSRWSLDVYHTDHLGRSQILQQSQSGAVEHEHGDILRQQDWREEEVEEEEEEEVGLKKKRKRKTKKEVKKEEEEEEEEGMQKDGVCTVIAVWLLHVPATCKCISETGLLRQFYVLPH